MSEISYQNKLYSSDANESVLDTLLRHGVDIPYACKMGACHVCVMSCESGEIPPEATEGLVQDNFLACQCVPKEDLSIRDAVEFGIFSQALVTEKNIFSDNVCQIKLKTATKMYYRAGQYINIRMPNGQIRSYSLASLPSEDDFLELHVKKMNNGVVSSWLFDDISIADTLDIQGPYGDCYYFPGRIDTDILMIGTGTGLAPLIGVLRDAINSGHKGNIHLYHGASTIDGLYYMPFLKKLNDENNNIKTYACASHSDDNFSKNKDYFVARSSDLAFSNHSNLTNFQVYLCGSPQMINEARIQAVKLGAVAENIYADPFETKDLRLGKER